MLKINNLSVVFNKGTVNEKIALDNINLELEDGDFVTIIGSNGAGKSTLLNAISGSIDIASGSIINGEIDITNMKEHQRARFIGRLFQDPLKGTAPSMTVEENLGLAYQRGKRMKFGFGVTKANREIFKNACKQLDLGLEDRLLSPVGLLSGGQRQALTLLMATIQTPDLLLLDEHTAALDPKTSKKVMDITKAIVAKDKITTLMITHNIEDALKTGNKMIVMSEGKIVAIIDGETKRNMNIEDVLRLYSSNKMEISDASFL